MTLKKWTENDLASKYRKAALCGISPDEWDLSEYIIKIEGGGVTLYKATKADERYRKLAMSYISKVTKAAANPLEYIWGDLKESTVDGFILEAE